MSNYADAYRRRINSMGNTSRKRNMARKQREFELYFDRTLNREECEIDGVDTYAVFQDQSQSNNKDLSDDKYVIVPNNVNVGVGSYIKWRDELWLVFTEEVKTIPTHQQLKVKHINRNIKWLVDKDNKIICNNGQGWPAYVQNQTLYTLGVSFSGQHLPLANAKMSVYIRDTPETRKMTVGTRIFIAGQVYKIEFADYVSRIGLINWLLDEDTKNVEKDNFELEIADYYDGSSDKDNQKLPSKVPDSQQINWEIEGPTKIRLGRTYTFKISSESEKTPEVEEWTIGDIQDLPFYVQEKDTESLTIRVKDDYRYVGNVVSIAAKINGEYKNLAVKVIKKFG